MKGSASKFGRCRKLTRSEEAVTMMTLSCGVEGSSLGFYGSVKDSISIDVFGKKKFGRLQK
jgi:hypothetical protein